jgi:4-diphosphocytidyl-2-C-methyl-D-erythritol kinase
VQAYIWEYMNESADIVIPAWAKINLGLAVTAKRPDGYHDIATVFHRIAWHDDLRLGAAPEVTVESSDPAAPGGEANLCTKAATLLKQATGFTGGVHCRLQKFIPVGAGLGGGSSDAAAILRALPDLWGIPTTEETLSALAIRIGSDVPYFLSPGSAFATGRGERLEYFDLDVPFAILVCHPAIHISTSWAYGQITPRRTAAPDWPLIVTEGMTNPDILRAELVNDFDAPVIHAYPAVGEVKQAMHAGGAVYASLSGSGSAVFGLFESDADARIVAAQFIDRGYRTSITPPHFRP